MAQRRDDQVQLALEQLSSDESLTADLTDSSAEALLRWIEDELRAAPEKSVEALEVRISALRRAAKAAARAHPDSSAALLAAARAGYNSAAATLAAADNAPGRAAAFTRRPAMRPRPARLYGRGRRRGWAG